MNNTPLVNVIVSYMCENCGISGIRRKDVRCAKCGILFNWSKHKAGKLLSSKKVQRAILKAEFEEFKTIKAGRPEYFNAVKLSIKK